MAKETLLVHPDFGKPFDIYADASLTQLGGTIQQDGNPLAFYSRKLTGAQLQYSVTELELLSIVEILQEYRNLLYG